VHAQAELDQVNSHLEASQKEARVGAEVRFGLHQMLDAQAKGTL
jgi:hypothetical protein